MKDLAAILDLNGDPSTKAYRKGDIIQRADDRHVSAIYVKQGLLRSYLIDSKGREHVYMFAPEGWIIGDVEAMEYDQPVQLYIDCLEDSVVVPLDKGVLFSADLPAAQLSDNAQLLYRRIGRLQRRVLMLMGAPIIDRYRYFVKTYPELPNRVPQHMIASFLGVAPQTLSTVRGKIARSG
ncbi:MAG: Crp/Fnr family transcriptional regulator [Bacteroidota bacterium]